MPVPRLVDKADALRALGCGYAHFYHLIREGVLAKPVKIAGRSYWLARDVNAAIDRIEARRHPRPYRRRGMRDPERIAP